MNHPQIDKSREERAAAYRADILARIAAAAEEARSRRTGSGPREPRH